MPEKDCQTRDKVKQSPLAALFRRGAPSALKFLSSFHADTLPVLALTLPSSELC
jgi:hypothetical protein